MIDDLENKLIMVKVLYEDKDKIRSLGFSWNKEARMWQRQSSIPLSFESKVLVRTLEARFAERNKQAIAHTTSEDARAEHEFRKSIGYHVKSWGNPWEKD